MGMMVDCARHAARHTFHENCLTQQVRIAGVSQKENEPRKTIEAKGGAHHYLKNWLVRSIPLPKDCLR